MLLPCWTLCGRTDGLVSCNGKLWPGVKTHWFRSECSLLNFMTICTDLRLLSLLTHLLSVVSFNLLLWGAVHPETPPLATWCFSSVRLWGVWFFSPAPQSAPENAHRLVSNTSVYGTDSAFLLSYKRLLAPKPNRSGAPALAENMLRDKWWTTAVKGGVHLTRWKMFTL